MPKQLVSSSLRCRVGGLLRLSLSFAAAVLHVKAVASLALISFLNCCIVLKSFPAPVRHFVRPVSSSPAPGNELCVASFQQFKNEKNNLAPSSIGTGPTSILSGSLLRISAADGQTRTSAALQTQPTGRVSAFQYCGIQYFSSSRQSNLGKKVAYHYLS